MSARQHLHYIGLRYSTFQPGVKRRMSARRTADAAARVVLMRASERQARIKIYLGEKSTAMKLLLAIAATVLLCAACAQGGSAPPSADSSGITMYGTVDEGLSYHSK
jgi:hypothetical protein